MLSYTEWTARRAAPSRDDRARRRFLNRLIASDAMQGMPAPPRPAPSIRPQPPSRFTRVRKACTVLAHAMVQAVSQGRQGLAIQVDRTSLLTERAAIQLTAAFARKPQHATAAMGGLAVGSALCVLGIAALSGLHSYQDVQQMIARHSSWEHASLLSTAIATDDNAAVPGATPLVIAIQAKDNEAASLPFVPVLDATVAGGVVMFRDMPAGVALTRGNQLTAGIWIMPVATLADVQLVTTRLAPQRFQIGIDVVDHRGARHSTFALAVTRAPAAETGAPTPRKDTPRPAMSDVIKTSPQQR